jgi:hypothetical protein
MNADSFRLGDALERYGESRRLTVIPWSPPVAMRRGRTGLQPPRMVRRSARWAVHGGSDNLQEMPSRTLVAHGTIRSIHPRTRARSWSDIRRLRHDRSYRYQVPGCAGSCASSGREDSSVAACTGTQWLARHRLQALAARHGSVARLSFPKILSTRSWQVKAESAHSASRCLP